MTGSRFWVTVRGARMDPYADTLEHVLAELERIDLFIRLQVVRARQWRQGDDPFLGLHISEDEVDALVAGPAGLPRWARAPARLPPVERALEEMALAIAARKEASAAHEIQLRLPELVQLFGLSPFDVDVLLICLAPEIDLRYERLFAYLQDDVTRRRPSVDLVLNLLSPSFRAKLAESQRFSPGAPLIHHRLVELFEDPAHTRPPLLGRYLKLDPRILGFLLGSDEIEASLGPWATLRVLRTGGTLELVPTESRASIDRATAEFATRGRLLVHLEGPRGVGKKVWAEALSAQLRRGVLIVDGEGVLAADRESLGAVARVAVREATLQGAALYWSGFDALLGDDRRPARRALLDVLGEWSGLSFVAGSRPWAPETDADRITCASITLSRPGHAERERIWASQLGVGLTEAVVEEIPVLASKFRFTPGEIRAAARSARERARWRSPEQPAPTVKELYASCRAQSTPALGELAKKIEPHHTWNDLVLPADATRQLRELCGRVRDRTHVLETWGFERKLSLGKGLNALFSGPSGTGKTMAAEIMAGELGLDLFKIDLSSVVSKYIGETEKHLARVFGEAEATSAILFFDEADALFGKRSEVKDAHDRYANVETSYLLQRMEEYEGISILATNLRRNMDEAFVRRLAFMVQFPLPEEAERRRIWQGVFPEATPRAPDVDLAFMSRQFKLAGGNIKNIALAAAFLAASERDGKVVTMRHLVRATRRELQKLGKSAVAGEFGAYGGMVEE